MIVKTSRHKLESTDTKNSKLDVILQEYSRCVSEFITLLWNNNTNIKFVDKGTYKGVGSWLSARMMQNCGKQALGIVKSAKSWNEKIVYLKWKRVYAYSKKNDRGWKIEEKYSVWRSEVKLRDRVLPKYDGSSMDLNANCICLEGKKTAKEFDFWIKMRSIGSKVKLDLPTKDHKHCVGLVGLGFQRKDSIRVIKKGDEFYVDLVWNKEEGVEKVGGTSVGMDLGVNKMIYCSDGNVYGTGLKGIINRLNKKVKNSKGYKRNISELKNYIGREVNKVEFSKIDCIVLEDLKGIKNRKGGKASRKLLSHWNRKLITSKIFDSCRLNRVRIKVVSPSWTSQKCSSCGEIHEESRVGEDYKCVVCGFVFDADLNAAVNILDLYLKEDNIVPLERKTN